MQVVVEAHEVHRDAVPARLERLIVQRLCDIADEVDDELDRLSGVGGGQLPVARALRVVGDGGDDAAGRAAVACEVDVAGRGWIVFCINEVEGG